MLGCGLVGSRNAPQIIPAQFSGARSGLLRLIDESHEALRFHRLLATECTPVNLASEAFVAHALEESTVGALLRKNQGWF